MKITAQHNKSLDVRAKQRLSYSLVSAGTDLNATAQAEDMDVENPNKYP
ncbi:MAG: hypothetical protein MSG64_14785 [Pyrinomonadaceae bacterium MAG19_C2-C3]|nr:hypothetical protein [Pyrinomonadaceae bacterium MAG19_C2-C3]